MNIYEVSEIASWIFLIYGVIICSGYTVAAVFSFLEIRDYKRKNNFQAEFALLQSSNLPNISILAPAFNEEANIVENVRSLLTLNYPSYEIVIINDGSSDDTLKELLETFDMEIQEFQYHAFIPSKKVRNVYKSKNKSFKSLTVVDKENGGKADALNTGINVCENEIICCIDVDCILMVIY